MDSEQLQREHYNRISEQYEAHYSDASSRQYRLKFILQPMFEGIKLSGMSVLDAMCGSGQTAEYLLSRGALVTGLDISSEAIAAFQRQWPSCRGVCRSIIDSGLIGESFDCVVVVGGLHHMHPQVSEAVREIGRVLKPGGYFCFMEPHSRSVPDLVRKRWYKHDPFFSDNEAAIDLEALKREFSSTFKFKREAYMGNVGFLLVLNSMIFRIPLRFKPIYTPTLLSLEAMINKIQGRLVSCFVVAQWQKR